MLEIGDLVLGQKPWNQGTYLGVVVNSKLEQSLDTFHIFWLNREDNKFIPARTFLSWEVPNSVKRIDNV